MKKFILRTDAALNSNQMNSVRGGGTETGSCWPTPTDNPLGSILGSTILGGPKFPFGSNYKYNPPTLPKDEKPKPIPGTVIH